MLEIINLKKEYTTKAGKTLALDNVSLRFADVGLVFITGKSGSGKTTLLNVIGGLDDFDDGDIEIDGRKFSEFSAKDFDSYRNTVVGFVFQEYNLLPDYNVRKNVAIADELQGKKSDAREIEKLFEQVEIAGIENRKINQLSGGQKQRVAISRALLKSPKIILADEPTGALDSETGEQAMRILKELSKEKLVIVVSHDLEYAEKYGDRIIRLVDGRVIEDSTLTDYIIEDNIYETDAFCTVKKGSDLTDEEVAILRNAIKNDKPIDFTSTLSVRARKPTVQPEKLKGREAIKFIPSKMRFFSACLLGIKALTVKPVRLIITILLSVIAFAGFGGLDAIASFNEAKAITCLLSENYYSALPVYAVYNDDYYSGTKLKISQTQIAAINDKTGYTFRGVYDITDTEYIDANVDRGNYNASKAIEGLPNDFKVEPVGSAYYYREANGIITFKAEEIQGDIIDKAGFNYRILYGRYPIYDGLESIQQVAISSYLSESILYWLKTDNLLSFGGKEITEIEDFIGARLSIGKHTFIISGIIDCGRIPSKYEELKQNHNRALADDFDTYLNAGCFLNIFAPEGFIGQYIDNNNRISCHYADYKKVHRAEIDGKSFSLNEYFYNANEIPDEQIILFDNNQPLKDDEVLIHVGDLQKEYFSQEFASVYSTEYSAQLASLISVLNQSSFTHAQKTEYMKTFLGIMEEIQNKDTQLAKTLKKPIILKSYEVDGKTICNEKAFKVAGVYFGVNTQASSALYPKFEALAMSSNAMKSMNVVEQGIYSRMIAPLFGNGTGAKTMGKLMTQEKGMQWIWFENGILESIARDKETLKQSLELFLYGAIVLAVFSIFMLFNYISVSIQSKRHSIGVLRALGANTKNIFTMFLVESFIIAFLNGLISTLIAWLGCLFVNTYLVNIMNLSFQIAMFDLRQVVLIFLGSIGAAFVASLLPILKISKSKPVNLIRKS